MKNGFTDEPESVPGKAKRQRMIGKKVGLGVLMFLILLLFGNVLESVENPWSILVLWLTFVLCLVLLNNALCRKWLSLGKLERYKYSWREFGLILLLFFAGRSRTGTATSTSQNLGGSIALYLFLGYLMFYLSERYIKRRVLKLLLKSVPFLLFIGFVLLALAPHFGALMSPEPKAVRYLDTRSGEVFEISGGDIEKAVPLSSDLAGARRELLSYDSLLVMFEEDRIDYDRFTRMTSDLEKSVGRRIRNMRGLADEIQCPQYRDILVYAISSLDTEFLGYSKYKDGVVTHDSVLTEIGLQLIQHVGSEYTELIKLYASMVRVEPGDQIDEQRRVGLLKAEAVEISMELNEYELAFVDFSYGDLTSSEFRRKKRQYESALAERFHRCDSLMQLIDRPVAISVFRDYLNYDDLDSSIPHQRFQALSATVTAFTASDSASYEEAYDRYYRLREESDAFWMEFISSFEFE